MIRYILLDIEGTTSSIDFVHQVLFPYSAKHLEDFVRNNMDDPIVQQSLDETIETMAEEDGSMLDEDEAITQLLQWIEEDRKHMALKRLQGLIWEDGYVDGEYKSHIYDDVIPALDRWEEKGISLGIYSSGSQVAQKLFFEYSDAGDIRHYFSDFFDTEFGSKKDQESYQNIQLELGVPANNILFVSDVGFELDAARMAGLKTVQMMRPDNDAPAPGHRQVTSFDEIEA